jgi:hypothetical protein
VIAKDVADLHGASNNLNKDTALSEKGEVISGRGDTPNRHDILTGSQSDGTAFSGADDRTCGNWTKSAAGAAMVGHHDRQGLNTSPPMLSWNSSHPSRGPGRRLQPERPEEHRRRRAVLLLRGAVRR